jgi:hypothetical protein
MFSFSTVPSTRQTAGVYRGSGGQPAFAAAACREDDQQEKAHHEERGADPGDERSRRSGRQDGIGAPADERSGDQIMDAGGLRAAASPDPLLSCSPVAPFDELRNGEHDRAKGADDRRSKTRVQHARKET